MSRPELVHLDSEESLAHYGVKGMRWGVRKVEGPGPNVGAKGVTVRADGSISVQKGANLQRLVRSNGKSLPMKDLTYASLTEYDNARYVKTIGGKGFFGGGRDQILGITAVQRIEAPSKDEATRIVSDLMLNNKGFRDKNTTMLGTTITDKELNQIREDPVGKTAKAWYEMTNQKLTFDAEFDPDAPHVQNVLRDTFMSKGYNAVRDENDFSSGLAKAPVVIFSPEKSLKMTSVTDITDELRAANKEKLKQYKSQGQEWLERELYGT